MENGFYTIKDTIRYYEKLFGNIEFSNRKVHVVVFQGRQNVILTYSPSGLWTVIWFISLL
jgi:hypothetical protein